MRVVKSQLSYCLNVLAELTEAGHGVGVSLLAKKIDIPKTSCQRILQQLIEEDWVEQDEITKFYRLTMRMPVLGQLFLTSLGVTDAVQAILSEIARRTRELVRITIVEGERLVWIGSAQGAYPGLMYQPAMETRIVSFATANGKAWLAYLDPETAERIAIHEGINHPTPIGVTGPNAHRSVSTLRTDLAKTRKRGYAIAVEEAEPGITALACGIIDTDSGLVLGTISVAGPSFRFPSERYHPLSLELRKAAIQIAKILPNRPHHAAKKVAKNV
jgi:IclR family transcriptional regulator, acetate operon repressor